MNDTIYGCTNCQRLHNTLIKCQEANQKFLLKIKRLKAKQLPSVWRVENLAYLALCELEAQQKISLNSVQFIDISKAVAQKIVEGMK